MNLLELVALAFSFTATVLSVAATWTTVRVKKQHDRDLEAWASAAGSWLAVEQAARRLNANLERGQHVINVHTTSFDTTELPHLSDEVFRP